jgi:hypothetical protein
MLRDFLCRVYQDILLFIYIFFFFCSLCGIRVSIHASQSTKPNSLLVDGKAEIIHTYRVRRMSEYTLRNSYNSLIRGRRRLYIGSYESLGYDTYNRASQMFVKTLEIRYNLAYLLCLEIGCAHLKILQSRF